MLEDVIDTIDIFSGIDLDRKYEDRRMKLTLYHKNDDFYDILLQFLDEQGEDIFYFRGSENRIVPAFGDSIDEATSLSGPKYSVFCIGDKNIIRPRRMYAIPFCYNEELPYVIMDNNFTDKLETSFGKLSTAMRKGLDDPGRKNWYDCIISDIYDAAHSMNSVSERFPKNILRPQHWNVYSIDVHLAANHRTIESNIFE